MVFDGELSGPPVNERWPGQPGRQRQGRRSVWQARLASGLQVDAGSPHADQQRLRRRLADALEAARPESQQAWQLVLEAALSVDTMLLDLEQPDESVPPEAAGRLTLVP